MKRQYRYYVYIVTNKYNNVLYVGVTNNIFRRTNEHQGADNRNSFTSRYNLNKLVYYEVWGEIGMAIDREKQIKGGSRSKKISLIESINPGWDDLLLKDLT